MKRDQLVELLRTLGAYSDIGDFLAWAQSLPAETTAAEVWAESLRGDWLVRLIASMRSHGMLTRQTLVLAACAAARPALREVVACDDRPRIAIETAEAWARGAASDEQMQVARARVRGAIDGGDSGYSCAAHAAFYAISIASDLQFAGANANSAVMVSGCSAVEFVPRSDKAQRGVGELDRYREIADAVRVAVPWSTVEAAVARLYEGKQS